MTARVTVTVNCVSACVRASARACPVRACVSLSVWVYGVGHGSRGRRGGGKVLGCADELQYVLKSKVRDFG